MQAISVLNANLATAFGRARNETSNLPTAQSVTSGCSTSDRRRTPQAKPCRPACNDPFVTLRPKRSDGLYEKRTVESVPPRDISTSAGYPGHGFSRHVQARPMPTEIKPLFHPAAIRDAMKAFTLPPAAVAARAKVLDWAKQLGSRKLDTKKETELLPDFIADVFEGAARLHPAAGRPATRSSGKRSSRWTASSPTPGWGGSAATARHVRRRARRQGAERPARPAVRGPQAVRRRAGRCSTPSTADRLVSRHQPEGNPALPQGPRHRSLTSGSRRRRWPTTTTSSAGSSSCSGPSASSAPAGRTTSTSCSPSPRTIGRELTDDYYREYRDLRRQTFQALRDAQPRPRRRPNCSPRRRRSSTACCSSPSARTAGCCRRRSSRGPTSTPTRSTRGRSGRTSTACSGAVDEGNATLEHRAVQRRAVRAGRVPRRADRAGRGVRGVQEAGRLRVRRRDADRRRAS